MGHLAQCSALGDICRHIYTTMVPLLILLVSSTLGEEENITGKRNGKSLTNTFPFNARNSGSSHREHHGDHEASERLIGLALGERGAKQGSNEKGVGFDEVAGARPGSDGKRCIDKVEMDEVTEYDDVVQCDHSYDRRCHTTYVTQYETQQEEECEENFRKNCFIDYEKTAWNETVEVCKAKLKKNCDKKGPEVCRTEYETECWTTTEKHNVIDDVVSCRTVVDKKCYPETNGYTEKEVCSEWPREVCEVTKTPVEKHTPITGCHKIPIEICAPAGCKVEPEPVPDCWNKTQTIVQDKPKEECTL